MDYTNRSKYNSSLPRFNPPLLTDVEANFDALEQLQWFNNNQTVAIYSTIVYCFLIFVLHLYMKRKQRYELRSYAIAWNFFLAAFSFCVVLRVGPDIAYDVYYYGYEFVLCDSSWIVRCPATGFWGTLFVFSKIVEFGDTVFIVLRKRPITVLHMYHHTSVPLALFYLTSKQVGPGRLPVIVNSGVHTIMYSYFGIRMMGYKVPMWTSMIITTIQILQMIYGISAVVKINEIINEGRKCDIMPLDNSLVFFLAVSYTILFGNFFYQSYIKKPESKSELNKQD